jgi:anaerobic selenocysteine-containing dehydrogenase
MRDGKLEKVLTACTRDCPGSCSIIAGIENGKVVSLKGNPDHPYTQGFLCPSTAKYLQERHYNSQRVLNPLLKVEGRWKKISWNQALDIIAEKLLKNVKEYGSESILYYQGFGARTALRILNKRFFNLLGGVSTLYGTVCGGIGQSGQEIDMGTRISHDPEDHLHSRNIIIWGRNPAITDIHLWKIIKKAQKKGINTIVIDPIKTRTARLVSQFYQPKPNSDAYLALAMAKIIIRDKLYDVEFLKNHSENFSNYLQIVDKYTLEDLSLKCDISQENIEELARIYVDGPSSIITGWGLHRYKQGHLTFRMIDALAAVSGNIGVSGGGVSQGFDEYGFFDHSWNADEMAPKARKLPMPIIGQAILDAQAPPIKMIFITAGNPVAMCPNSGKVKNALKSVDFVVMVDHFLNDTSQEADLFLPATNFLEELDLVGGYGHNVVAPLNPVIKPRGEARSELWIFQQLSQRLGFADDMKGSAKEWLEKLASPLIKEGFTIDELMKKPVRVPSPPLTPFIDKKFYTRSGKFRFISSFEMEEKENEEFPLRLLSIMPGNWIGSEIPEEEHGEGYLEINVNPLIIEYEGLEEGDLALLESKIASLPVIIRADKESRIDCISTYRGGWMSFNKCVNVLTEDIISDKGDGTPYYETRVRIKKMINSR